MSEETSHVDTKTASRTPIKPVPAPERHKPKRTNIAQTVFLVLFAGASGFAGGTLGSQANPASQNSLSNETRQQIVSSEGELISSITKEVGPSVVSISVTTRTMLQGFFGLQESESTGAGTGVIISDDGIVITNRHVVPEGANEVSVTLSDGTLLDDVEVIGRTISSDPLDIAFLKIKDTKGKKLTVANIGDSAAMEVGDRVIAIGNALGQFENTVTSGILSGYGRDVQARDGVSVESLQNLFQTDAAINPGNSGGPLMNLSGEVVGINVAVADGQNLGFAIPINDVKGLIASVRKNGKLERPYLGVRYVSLTDDAAYFYNLDVKRGAYIAPSRQGQPSVISGSPADRAGLREKDIIVAVNDVAIDERNSLVSVLGRFSVGDTVDLKIVRDGNEQILSLKLEAAPQDSP